jgi:lysozyme
MTALELIESHEGLRLFPYKDTNGEETIGYGFHLDRLTSAEKARLIAAHGSMAAIYQHGITYAEASLLTSDVVDGLTAWATQTFPWFHGLSETRQAVIIDMAYELGEGRPGQDGLLGFPKFLAAMARGDIPDAVAEMKNSHWATQVPSREQNDAKLLAAG